MIISLCLRVFASLCLKPNHKITKYEKLRRPATTLLESFEHSPLSDIDLDIERSKDGMPDFDF